MPALDAESVRDWRNRRMLSQQEVADLADTSLFTIRRIERGVGSVRPQTGRAVAQALGVAPEELLPKAQAPLPFEESATAPQAVAGRTDMEAWAKVRACVDVGDTDGAFDALQERLLEMFPEMRHHGRASVEELMEAMFRLGGTLRASEELSTALQSPSPETSVADVVHLATALHFVSEESIARGWHGAETTHARMAD